MFSDNEAFYNFATNYTRTEYLDVAGILPEPEEWDSLIVSEPEPQDTA
jgi:hypothetical protein